VSIPFFSYQDHSVADLGEDPEGPGPPLFWVKRKKSEKVDKPAGQAKQNRPLLPLAQSLDAPPPLVQKRRC